MKRLLVIVALIAIFTVAFASLSRKAYKEKQGKKPASTEKKCSYRSNCMF